MKFGTDVRQEVQPTYTECEELRCRQSLTRSGERMNDAALIMAGAVMVAGIEVAEPPKQPSGFKHVLAHAYPSTEQIEHVVAHPGKPNPIVAALASVVPHSMTAEIAVRHRDETERNPLG